MKLTPTEAGMGIAQDNWAAIFDSIAAPVAIVGGDGRILQANGAWRSYATRILADAGQAEVGAVAGDLLAALPGIDAAEARRAAAAVAEILAGERTAFEAEPRLAHGGDVLWLRIVATRVQIPEGRAAVLTFADVSQQRRELEVSSALARAGSELIERMDRPAILERLCQLTGELVPAEVCVVLFLDPERNAYRPVAQCGTPPEQWESLRLLSFPRGLVSGGAFPPNACVQVITEGNESPAAQVQGRFGFSAVLYAALLCGDQVLGNLLAAARTPGARFSPHQERMVSGITRIASFALTNAALFDELEHASRIKSEFVATMSHELRTPLNIILGYNELLLDGEFGAVAAPQETPLRRIAASARGLLELIESTLDLSRLEAGRVDVERQVVDAGAVLAEVRASLREVTADPRVEFVWEIPAEPLLVSTDPLKLGVILKNLIDNARKFTAAGRVTVGARAGVGEVEFRVADTGSGIPPETLPTIFEGFRQGANAADHLHGGVGLGLHIVRRMLDLLGGAIDVDSEVGRGTTFTVRLPAG